MIKTSMGQWSNIDTMSVTELITELQKIPNPDTTPVVSDGCDCTGVVMKVTTEDGGAEGKYAYLWREDH